MEQGLVFPLTSYPTQFEVNWIHALLKYTLYIHVIVLQLYAQKIKCSLTYIISASIKAVVDGAVNELHKYNQTIESKDMLIPDLISGDFDSINPDLLQHYREKVIAFGKIALCIFRDCVWPNKLYCSVLST